MNAPQPPARVNLGCGARAVDGWINVDYALGARLARVPFFRTFNRHVRVFENDWSDRIIIHNLAKALPWADASIDVVYSSHTLEHLARDDGRGLLAECHRVLRADGIIRIVVPDLRHEIDEYVAGRLHAEDFVEKLQVLYRTDVGAWKRPFRCFIQSPHQCMYDAPRLLAILREIGFEGAGRAAFDSDISDIRRIEVEPRTRNAVIVEGRKRHGGTPGTAARFEAQTTPAPSP